jgi:hypothetical protein
MDHIRTQSLEEYCKENYSRVYVTTLCISTHFITVLFNRILDINHSKSKFLNVFRTTKVHRIEFIVLYTMDQGERTVIFH